MTKRRIGIVDYGLGNLYSVVKAFDHLGISAIVTHETKPLAECDALVLPGVGAFRDGMEGLIRRDLISLIQNCVKQGRPLLGICLGMQMLMEESLEMGRFKGLGFIEGGVHPFQPTLDKPVKVPHMGWSQVNFKSGSEALTGQTKPASLSMYYFVHSYFAVPLQEAHVIGESEYGGQKFCSVLRSKNIFGCQFHPEKSGEDGLRLLKAFADLE